MRYFENLSGVDAQEHAAVMALFLFGLFWIAYGLLYRLLFRGVKRWLARRRKQRMAWDRPEFGWKVKASGKWCTVTIKVAGKDFTRYSREIDPNVEDVPLNEKDILAAKRRLVRTYELVMKHTREPVVPEGKREDRCECSKCREESVQSLMPTPPYDPQLPTHPSYPHPPVMGG